MSDVQRWAPFEPMALMGRHPDGAFVRYADHARIVAEAAAEARAAERRHWEARFRNAEAAHAAALADANLRWDAEVTRALDEGEKIGRLYGSTPRTLTTDDRAAIAKVLRDNGADSGTDMHDSWRCADKERYPEPCDCIDRLANSIMFTLIHDGEDR